MNVHRSWLINILLVGLIIIIGMQSGCDSGSRSSYVPGIGGAYSEADMQRLKDTGNCVNCSLSGADLHGQNLNKANLSGTELSGANLTETNLTDANLEGADLAWANLQKANLTGANLTRATIDNADMVGASMMNVTGPTGMPGRVINLVNSCGIDIWAAASGNTMAKKCRSNAECNGGKCPPLTGNCVTDTNCYNLCTTYPCGSNGDCPEPNTYCGGLPSFKDSTSCKKDADCGANLFCNTTTGQCGWKNCTYVPIPVENTQIVAPAVSCTSNKDCSGTQFCYTTTSTSGKCATLPDASKGNSWLLNPGEKNPLFVPTPWAGRFWPRTGCVIGGSVCTDLYAGSDAQCAATSVNSDRKLIQPLTNPQVYPVKCRTDSDCGPSATNKSVVGGKCNLSGTPAYDPGQQHQSSECKIGDDTTCDAVKGAGSNYVCVAEKISSGGQEVTIGVCGYRNCTAYQCDSLGKNQCYPASFSCETGTCYNEQSPAQLTRNCRQSGLNSPTLAELNMFLPSKGIDYYDISLVDGANVPVQIAPVVNTYVMGTNDAVRLDVPCKSNSDCWKLDDNLDHKLDSNWVCDTVNKYCVNKFYCGSPGCVSDCTTYGNKLTDPSTWGARNLAVAEKDCPEELKLKSGATYIGCLSPTDACSDAHKNDSWRTKLSCDKTHMNLFQCEGANATSCYTKNAGTDCCGCPDWMPTEFCAVGKNSNPSWVSLALPYYKVFHTASPNSYTYPFDDKSGTFTCKGQSDAINVNYNITFCPK